MRELIGTGGKGKASLSLYVPIAGHSITHACALLAPLLIRIVGEEGNLWERGERGDKTETTRF